MDHLIDHPVIIASFVAVVVGMLGLDLGLFNRKSHAITNREALVWSVVWISLSMLFSVAILVLTYPVAGMEKFAQFQSAYWIEKALSVDNLFVFILVFTFFKVPRNYYHKVLFWGIMGALVMRGLFIFSGVRLIELTYLPEMVLFGRSVSINLVLTLFGAFLLFAGVRSWFADHDAEDERDFRDNPGARFIRLLFRVHPEYDRDRFFSRVDGKRVATQLLVVLAVIEFTDLVFAVDSIPAIFAIAPDDPFILYTSNIFAILGLRSLFFLLANFIHMFSRLRYGLALILAFIGVKMMVAPFFHMSAILSLGVVGSILVLSILLSILFPVPQHRVEGHG